MGHFWIWRCRGCRIGKTRIRYKVLHFLEVEGWKAASYSVTLELAVFLIVRGQQYNFRVEKDQQPMMIYDGLVILRQAGPPVFNALFWPVGLAPFGYLIIHSPDVIHLCPSDLFASVFLLCPTFVLSLPDCCKQFFDWSCCTELFFPQFGLPLPQFWPAWVQSVHVFLLVVLWKINIYLWLLKWPIFLGGNYFTNQ